ncbi:MAG: RNA polymerase sigma factor [Clostridia bacterium]|nr:RNA polymerase sigma factor [Clostridia bacterium]
MISDTELIMMFDRRDEDALSKLDGKYGRYCRTVAMSVLDNEADAEECVNDAYLKVWQSIPPAVPEKLSSYLALVVKNRAIDMRREQNRKKNIPSVKAVSIDELGDVPSGGGDPAESDAWITELIGRFLQGEERRKRSIFIARYVHDLSIGEISAKTGEPEGTVVSILHRMRRKLEKFLAKEGVEL